jgi:hypothetical protein
MDVDFRRGFQMSRKGTRRVSGPIESRLRRAVRTAIVGHYRARLTLAAKIRQKPIWLTQFVRGQGADVDQAVALIRALHLDLNDLLSLRGIDAETLELRQLWEQFPAGSPSRSLVLRVVREMAADLAALTDASGRRRSPDEQQTGSGTVQKKRGSAR